MNGHQKELTEKQIEARVKRFANIVLKHSESWERVQDGFYLIKLKTGQTFKCRGPIVERAGLL